MLLFCKHWYTQISFTLIKLLLTNKIVDFPNLENLPGGFFLKWSVNMERKEKKNLFFYNFFENVLLELIVNSGLCDKGFPNPFQTSPVFYVSAVQVF